MDSCSLAPSAPSALFPDSRIWRLIPHLEAPGTVQMAIDRYLVEQHQLGLMLATLRFYTWSPPAISLGYHQHQYPDRWQNLIWHGRALDLVRRPTGGRAVLHQGDLTYAVVMSGLSGSRTQAYQQICEFLIQGWRSLGIQLHYGTAGRGYIHNPNCFGTATGADLVLEDGTKLIGSAQLRRGGVILQHGSMRLEPDEELFAQVFGKDVFAPVKLPLNQRGEDLIQTIIDALVTSAKSYFQAEFVVQPLSDREWEKVYLDCD
ncbi:lipoate--protein ligase family protein [Chroococcidiopsis sp. FACHB-1243]|uniref:lipoate--protein ligase family protein n=1 Tax=Chroococcidiopsis sp. [FACHB-1243] TaxID=2692781 RepID=UPI00177F80C9|nr:biotin/lipoate A/B protein ligase family protein [Chroococcidiopsis sp. [FACHB-1243]]MBD2308923.1 lipoate--protein ligase family protein [Chroococcidiopsis sp. [FACHB-1243]]